MLTAGATHIQRHVSARKGSSIFTYAFLSFEAGGKGWVEPGQGYATLRRQWIIVPVFLLLLPQSFALEH